MNKPAQAASALLSLLNNFEIPTPLIKICKLFNIHVIEVEAETLNIHGMLLSGKPAYIFIPAHLPYLRKRFSIAHELGHLFLGHKIELLAGNIHKLKERQANAFAAELLMPKKQVLKAYEFYGANIELLAKIFEVSYESMSIRLKELKLIEGEGDGMAI